MTVFCSEANGCLMMHQGRTCLLLWWSGGDADYLMFILVSVISMLLGRHWSDWTRSSWRIRLPQTHGHELKVISAALFCVA